MIRRSLIAARTAGALLACSGDDENAYRAFGLTFLGAVRNVFNTFYTDVQERSPGAPRQWSLGVYSEF